jgi:putative transposase
VIQKIRTDQGKGFKNLKVQAYFKTQAIEQRLNTPCCPEENGKIERFHRTLNEKCVVDMYVSDSLDALQYKLTLFLQYYNYQKRHRGLGMEGMTPMKKLASCRNWG